MAEGIRFREEGIAGKIFGSGDSPWCLNLPGLPGRPDGTPAVDYLISRGLTVVQPQYGGTYDSDGDFDPREAWRTVRNVVDLMARGLLSVDGSRSSAPVLSMAHSFGTHALVRAALSVACQSQGTTPLPASWDHLAPTVAG